MAFVPMEEGRVLTDIPRMVCGLVHPIMLQHIVLPTGPHGYDEYDIRIHIIVWRCSKEISGSAGDGDKVKKIVCG